MSMFFNNKSVGITVGKIKRMLAAAALMILCIMPLTLTVSAAANNEIKLEANGSEASLEFYFPQAAAEETASMQVSVSVKASSDSVNLEFVPDSGLAAKIVESRYQSSTGTLNIYLAGTESLFSSSEFTKVGRVKISTSGNNTVSAIVEVVKDSVKYVRSGELVSPDVDYPSSVTVTATGQSLPDTSNPSYPNYPSGNYFPNIPMLPADDNNRYDNDETRSPVLNDSDTDADAVLEEQDTIGENMNPPDTSALLDALSRADDYKGTDYTESSYADLREAADNANKLISDPNATQDEIDEALLNIENAIGMLKLRNDIPSGAEGYGENKDTGAYGGVSSNGEDRGYGQGEQPSDRYDTDHGGNGNDVQTSQSGNIVNASDGAQSVYADDPFSGNEDSGGNFPFWIIVIAAIAVAAAAAAIIVLKKSNNKKDADGNHFKD